MSDLGKNIQNARVQKGLTLKQLAKQCGVSETNIADIEAGRKIVNEALLKRIAKILEADLTSDLAELAQDEPAEQHKSAKPPGPSLRKTQTQDKPSEQWEMAFGNVMRKLPVYDLDSWQIVDDRLQPVVNNKIDGFAPDKIVFVRVKGSGLQGLGIKEGDLIKTVLVRDIIHNGIHLLRLGGKPCVRRVRKMDGDKVLLMDFDRENKTEMRDIRETEVIGRCLSAEIILVPQKA